MALTRTRFSQSNTAIARISDPITTLNNESTVANVDVGFLINRDQGTKSNVAWYWSESSNEFRSGFTSNSGAADANIVVSSYANVRLGTLYANIGGAADISNVYVTGSILPSANVVYDLGSTNKRFKTLWLSGNTIVMGRETLSVNDAGEWIFTSGANTVSVGSLQNFQGNGAIVGNLTVTNTLTLQGNTYTISTQNLTVVDSIVELHTLPNVAPLVSDDGRDIGLNFHYYKTQDEHAFLGWSNNTGYLEWYDAGREQAGNVFTGNTYGTFKTGGVYLVNTTPSTSTTTGVLQVAGGVGIAGNLYIAGTGDVSANIGTVRVNVNTLDANVGSYQAFANANAASQQTSINTLLSNAATQQVSINNLDANIGAYQIFANANAATQTTDIANIVSSANANTAAYFKTYTGNISTGNLITTGNVYGGLVPSVIYKDVFIGTTAVALSRSSGALTVDDFNTTGYAAQANLAALATNATKTTVSSNISSGTSYVTFVSSTTGNVDQNINTALTYDPNSGNLRAYGLLTDTAVYWASNGAIYGNSDDTLRANVGAFQLYANANISTLFAGNVSTNANLGAYQTYANANIVAIQANLGAYQTWANSSVIDLYTNANANTAAYLSTYTGNVQAGNLLITGNIRATSNVFANVFYVSDSIRWAGNGAVFASGGGGGGGITYTASNTAPVSPSIGDQWYYVASDILFEYINDGDSNQWVDVNGLGQLATSNVTLIGDAILQGNITVQNNNLYSIGAASGYLKNVFVRDVTANTSTVSGVSVVSGNLVAAAATTSTSITTGALVVKGGAAINGNVFVGGNIIPNANLTYNIGSSTAWFNTFYGVSTQAQYADLAENYQADANYGVGTVLVFGGACEVTVSTHSHDTRIAGVVSENPAYLMNAVKGNVSVALTGRVPCQVQGPVDKGTVLVSSSVAGVAQAVNTAQYQPGCVLGKSLETIEDNMIKTIEIAVGRF